MDKKLAKIIFGDLDSWAKALGITYQAISKWPDPLTKRQTHETLGAAILTGKAGLLELPSILKRIGET